MEKDTEVNGGEDSVIELTDREKAIAHGQDPDAVDISETDVAGDTPVKDGQAGGGDTVDGEEVGGGSQEAKDGGREATPLSWIDDTVRLAAKPYSLSEEDLAVFSSADEFRKAVAFFDKQMSLRAAADGKAADKTNDKEKEGQADESVADGVPDLDLQKFIDGGYDNETLDLVRYTKLLQEKLSKIETALPGLQATQSELRRQQIHSFHDIVDRMDEELYGRSLKDGRAVPLSNEQSANRKKLFDEMNKRVVGEMGTGGDVPPLPVLLGQAERVVFGDVLAMRDKKAEQARIAAQSKRRRAVASGTRASTSPTRNGGPRTAKEIAASPAIKDLWDKIQEENGGG